MLALTFHAPGDVRSERVPDPTILTPGDVIVQTVASAVCGSDLHVWHGRERGLDTGTVMGHELVGRIVARGAAVKSPGEGTLVVVPFTSSCGACWFCRHALSARCERGQLFGWVERGQGLQGTQAELVRVPLAASTLLSVPEGLAPELALLAGDVLSTGLAAAVGGAVSPGDRVAVIGCGPVGLMGIVACRERDAGVVLAVDPVPERRALAERLGAEACDPAAAPERARMLGEGRGVDAVLEIVGSPEATRLAYTLVRPGGTISAAGVHTETHLAFSPGEAYDKNLSYRAGRCSARHHAPEALSILASGRYPIAAILSHRFPLSRGDEAYRMFDAKADGCVKALLLPD